MSFLLAVGAAAPADLLIDEPNTPTDAAICISLANKNPELEGEDDTQDPSATSDLDSIPEAAIKIRCNCFLL